MRLVKLLSLRVIWPGRPRLMLHFQTLIPMLPSPTSAGMAFEKKISRAVLVR